MAGRLTRSKTEHLAGASIRVVSNRTGIAADTLRAWERRYGFPRPARRPGGTRVYSEDDVARLNLIARALAAGFRPGEVIPLPPEDVARLVAVSAADRPSAPAAARVIGESIGNAPSVEAVLAALCADDVVTMHALLRAASTTLGPRAFVTGFAHPLALRVGDLWAAGGLAIRHEHLMSATLTKQLHIFLGALADGDRSPAVLLTTLPGEPHSLGLEMVAVYLATSFAAPHVLGADTPAVQIAEAALAMGVDVVGLSISPAAEARATGRALAALGKALPVHVELWLGGAGARSVASAAPQARVVPAWSDLDAALALWRAR